MTGKKKINIVLIIVVLGLWGAVVYKAVSQYFFSEKLAAKTTNYSADLDLRQINKDTFRLEKVIRDPFLNKQSQNQIIVVSEIKRKYSKPVYEKPKTVIPVIKPKQYVNWPSISYYGYVRSKEKNEEFFLVKINQKVHKFRINEEVEGVTLKKVYKDSIEFDFNKEKKIIKKNNFS